MSSPTTLSAEDLRATSTTYGELLRSHREVINRLNVYPVPDGDTGTNMALTIESVVAAARASMRTRLSVRCRQPSPRVADGRAGQLGRHLVPAVARAWWPTFPERGDVAAPELAGALAHADELARQAVAAPRRRHHPLGGPRGGRGGHQHHGAHWPPCRAARATRRRRRSPRRPTSSTVLKQAGVVDSGRDWTRAALRRAVPRSRRRRTAHSPERRLDRRARARGARDESVARRTALRGHVPARRRRRQDARLSRSVGRLGRLDRHRRWRGPLQLSHPHRRDRRRHRGGPRRRSTPRDTRDRPHRAGDRGTLGP